MHGTGIRSNRNSDVDLQATGKIMYHQPIRLLHETLLDSAREAPGKQALVVGGRSYTYGELLDAASRCARALTARGVRRGDRVAIYMDNTFACVVSLYATLLSGAVFIVINPQTKTDKLKFVLEDSEAAVLVTDSHLARTFLPVLTQPTGLKAVLCSGQVVPGAAGVVPSIESFEAVVDGSPAVEEAVFSIPNDLAALVYTSGSTGNPKGVMMTHQSMVFTAGSLIQYLRLNSEQRILNFLPLAFDYGLYQLLMSVYLGATLVLERSFTYAGQVLQRMDEQNVTVFPGVPTVFTILVGSHRKSPICFPSVLRVTNTAAALPTDYNRDLHQIFPNALLYRMYGLTECKRVCYLEPELVDSKPESVGKAIPGTETFLLSESGGPVGPGENGILHVRGPHVMVGYWKQPELSRHMLKDGDLPGDRVLCSHDWFSMDDEGFLYFKGRSDDIIKTRGEKVSPVEVENVLYSIGGVKEAAAIGVADELLGQAVKAFVVLEAGASLTQRDILKHCTERLENFMVPKYVEFMDELPKTSTGKIRKAGLQ
jgi:long-chain acyl-CoA synthetase